MQFEVAFPVTQFVLVSEFKYFCSDRCKRGSVKTGKKEMIKLRCCHEETVRIFSGMEDGSSMEMASCANCSMSFDALTGGKCKHCKAQVLYCTAACQVSLDYS